MDYVSALEYLLTVRMGNKRKSGMISKILLKSGKVSFKARMTRSDGTQYHKTFKSEREAKRWLVQEKAKNLTGDYVINPKRIIIDDYFNLYLESIKPRVEYSTFRGYRGDIKNHILPIVKGKRMIDITYDDGRLVQKNIYEKGLNNKTNNKVIILLKQILSGSCVGKGPHRVLDKNPLDGLKHLPEIDKDMIYWDEKDTRYFLNHDLVKNNHYYDFYRVTFNMGLRLGEVAGLQVKKVDFNTNIMIISNALKPKEGGGHELGSTKTKETRYLKMNPVIRGMMERRVEGKGWDDFIFLSKTGKMIDVYHFCDRHFKPLQKQIEMKKLMRFHDVRHTYASNYFMKGGNFLSAQDILGHKDSKTTRRYIHAADQFKQQEANRIQF